MKKILILIALLSLMSCTDADTAHRLLLAHGYTNIQLTGYSFWGCDAKDDVFRTGFTASSPSGAYVEGIVCSGWLKAATIRFK